MYKHGHLCLLLLLYAFHSRVVLGPISFYCKTLKKKNNNNKLVQKFRVTKDFVVMIIKTKV